MVGMVGDMLIYTGDIVGAHVKCVRSWVCVRCTVAACGVAVFPVPCAVWPVACTVHQAHIKPTLRVLPSASPCAYASLCLRVSAPLVVYVCCAHGKKLF